jgi:hypothetical protein
MDEIDKLLVGVIIGSYIIPNPLSFCVLGYYGYKVIKRNVLNLKD